MTGIYHLLGSTINSYSSVPWLVWLQFGLFLAGCCAAAHLYTRDRVHALVLGSCLLFALVRVPDILSLNPILQELDHPIYASAKLVPMDSGAEILGTGLLVAYLAILCRKSEDDHDREKYSIFQF